MIGRSQVLWNREVIGPSNFGDLPKITPLVGLDKLVGVPKKRSTNVPNTCFFSKYDPWLACYKYWNKTSPSGKWFSVSLLRPIYNTCLSQHCRCFSQLLNSRAFEQKPCDSKSTMTFIGQNFSELSHEAKKTALLPMKYWLVKNGILILVYCNPYITG